MATVFCHMHATWTFYSQPFPIHCFQSLVNLEIIFLLHPAARLLLPSPTSSSKLTLLNTQSMWCILARGVAHSINSQAGSSSSSQPVRQAAREDAFFRRGSRRLGQSLAYICCSYGCTSLVASAVALIRLFVPAKSSLVMPNWHTLIQTPLTSDLMRVGDDRTIT